MGKRFTETTKWQDGWFLELPKEYKLAWLYILDTCTPAGRWKSNFRMLNFCCDSDITEEKFKKIFKGRVFYFAKGDYYFIPKFLKFQYPQGLTSYKPAIKSVRKEIEQYKLKAIIEQSLGNDYLIIKQSLSNDCLMIKDKDKDKEKEKRKIGKTVFLPEFEEIWTKYPSKDGKKEAGRHYASTVKTEKDRADISHALENYLNHLSLNSWKRPMGGKTWFNNWQDWVSWTEPKIKAKDPIDDWRPPDE